MEYPKYQFYCSCKLARKAFPRLLNHKLNTVAAHCGYNLTNHHYAMADAYACVHIAVTLMEKKKLSVWQIFDVYQKSELTWVLEISRYPTP